MAEVGLIFLVAFVSVIPLAGLSTLYGIAARVARDLGHWPSYGRPDPKDLPAPLAYSADWSGLLTAISVLAVLTPAIGFGLLRFTRPERMHITAAILVVSFWVGAIILLITDPFGVLDWYLD